MLRHFLDQPGQWTQEQLIHGLRRVGQVEAGLELIPVAQAELLRADEEGQENRRGIARIDQPLLLELLYLVHQAGGQAGFPLR